MKKYYIVTDVHSAYDEMIEALVNAGYDKNDKDSIFVSLGDLLDRYDKPLECLAFVNSIPNDKKILIRGNHEDLLESLFQRGYPENYDIGNGTVGTSIKLGYYNNSKENDKLSDKQFLELASKNPLWQKYQASLVDYAETDNYIFVHGYLPTHCSSDGYIVINSNWRNASENEWKEARWINGMSICIYGKSIEPNKTIVCGHWRASYGHYVTGKSPKEFGEQAIFTPFETKGLIAMDSCVAVSGFVNCIVVQEENDNLVKSILS